MGLSVGIVGLPNVGKSTLFNALLGAAQAAAANYPFCTIEPNLGVVPVPDPRLERLAAIYEPKKKTPTTLEFVDIAGLVAGASKGEGLGNQFLANIRETDAICEVVRYFTDPNVVHVDGRVDPASDVETIRTELVLADLGTVERALPRLEKEARGDKTAAHKLDVVIRARDNGGFSFVSDQTTYTADDSFVYNSLQAVYVADVRLADLEGDGQLKLYVGYWGVSYWVTDWIMLDYLAAEEAPDDGELVFVLDRVAGFLERANVRRQVAIGHIERAAQLGERQLGGGRQHRHDSQPPFLVNNAIELKKCLRVHDSFLRGSVKYK